MDKDSLKHIPEGIGHTRETPDPACQLRHAPESIGLFDDFKNKIEEIKRDIRTAVQVALLEESIRFELGRLTQLKPDRAEAYQQMLAIIGA